MICNRDNSSCLGNPSKNTSSTITKLQNLKSTLVNMKVIQLKKNKKKNRFIQATKSSTNLLNNYCDYCIVTHLQIRNALKYLIITQSDFLAWDLKFFICLISVMTITSFVNKDNCVRSLSY